MTRHFDQGVAHIVAFSGNTHRPSKSRALVAALAERIGARVPVRFTFLDLVDAGPGLGAAFKRGELSQEALAVVEAIEQCDGLIAASPVYKGSYTGLFKHLFDFVPPLALADRPVLIGATGGGHRHALVVEHQLRPLFGFFSAQTVPTSVYAGDEEFLDGRPFQPALLERIDAAAAQFAALIPQTHSSADISARNNVHPATAA